MNHTLSSNDGPYHDSYIQCDNTTLYDAYNSYYRGQPVNDTDASDAFEEANRLVESLPGEEKDIGTRWSMAFKLNAYMGVAYVA